VLHVAPDGEEGAEGSEEKPLSLEGARSAVRALSKAGLPAGGVAVLLASGDYERDASFVLTSEDSGTASAPVVYRAAPGASVRLLGGRRLDPAAFVPVPSSSAVYGRLDASVRDQVLRVDLKAQGVTDLGKLERRGFCSSGQKAALELALDGVPMQPGRWPDVTEHEVPEALEMADQIEIFGATTPDVSGLWVKDGVSDGVSSFARKGLVDGKQYHLYRHQFEHDGYQFQGWFLTTGTSGYPSDQDPWWWVFTSKLAALTPAAGAVGKVLARDPAWIHHGYAAVAQAESDTAFTYDSERPSRWVNAPDLWLHGFFQFDWADCHTPATLDVLNQRLTLASPPPFGIGIGQPWYAENLLEEITVPGEYYVDRTEGALYFLPPGPLAGRRPVVSLLSEPLLSIQGAEHLTIEGLTLESGRGSLVNVEGGSNVLLSHVRLLAAGTDAARISGTSNGIRGCEITGPGTAGVLLSGGDRKSLTPGGNFAEHCYIHDFSRFEYMYHPAVRLSGVGQRASHNLMHGAPHSAVLFEGNDHLVEKNEIHSVCKQTSDAGAIYSGRDWGARGNQVKFNYLHDISSVFEGYGVHAIYLDDCLSGVRVEGNVIRGLTGMGILHGGGRDNVMVNNVFARTARGIVADSRCVVGLSQGIPNNIPGDSWNLLEKLNSVGYQQEPWLSRFPECAAIPNDWAAISAPESPWRRPEGCVFERNVGLAAGYFRQGSQATFGAYSSIKDNLPEAGSLFVNEEAGDLSIRPDSPAMSLPGFAPPPFSEMGLGK
jgi:hypothetical protein